MTAACCNGTSQIITVKDGQFVKNGKPYYFIGTNMWYATILASEGEGGNRERLARELDSLKALGIDNLRILVGADGDSSLPCKVEPMLQTAPGVYNDTLLRGLDYLLVEMGKRDMQAVLYLNNSWEWSGGYSQYLTWAGYG
ncbi:MAG: beta-mannosidase, partial [Bacteroidales bacterium]|nr:beta-mannosidase [Bacteroidales bacterium]